MTPITTDAEVSVRFRLAVAPARVIWFWTSAGLKLPEENGENIYKLALATPAGPTQETVNWSTPPLPGKAQGAYGSCTFRNLPASRKDWPEMARARAEQDA